MEHPKLEHQSSGKKGGADGLSKKERRALRVQAQNKNTEKQTVQSESKSGTKPSVPATQSSVDSNKQNVSNNQDSNKESSKAESRAQRRAIQETQRLAKENAKNNSAIKDGAKDNTKNETQDKKVVITEAPNKNDIRAQRRAIQEAQRLAKEASKVQTKPTKENESPSQITEKKPMLRRASKKSVIEHRVQLFTHLYFKNTVIDKFPNGTINVSGIHAAFLRLGVQYASNTILGSNARCLALLSALKSLIIDFTPSSKQEFCRSLETTLQKCIAYLQTCRPLAVSMTNALKYFSHYLRQEIKANHSDDETRSKLYERVQNYIEDEINKAGEAISIQVQGKIINDDVILTYGCSSLVTKILLDAHKNGKKFKVIVVDARPLLEGKEMLRKLVTAGIQCTYVMINAASFIMGRATKVLLGAHALLANGYVMSRTGTAQVALIARAYNKPVLVCCETYKFCERAQTDSFVYNEIGDEDKLVSIDTNEGSSPLINWRSNNFLIPLNLMYDVTPPDLVTVVVTELAFLPCTSVPVILRIRPTETLIV